MSGPTLLALETATDACSVALRHAGGIAARHEVAPRRHTEIVLDMLDAVLAEAALGRADLDAVAFGRGPGSFTGVRVAAALAQGIALGREVPVCGVSTLAALAAGAARGGHRGRVVAVLDARRAEIYAATFDCAGGTVTRLGEDVLIAPEALLLPPGGDWLAAGTGWDVYAERFAPELRALPRAADAYPHAVDVATLAARELGAGNGQDAGAALPAYLRGALD